MELSSLLRDGRTPDARGFRQLYGLSPTMVDDVHERYLHDLSGGRSIRAMAVPENQDLLWALDFVFTYPTEEVGASHWGVSAPTFTSHAFNSITFLSTTMTEVHSLFHHVVLSLQDRFPKAARGNTTESAVSLWQCQDDA